MFAGIFHFLYLERFTCDHSQKDMMTKNNQETRYVNVWSNRHFKIIAHLKGEETMFKETKNWKTKTIDYGQKEDMWIQHRSIKDRYGQSVNIFLS